MKQQDTLRQLLKKLSAGREKEKKHLNEITACLLYEARERRQMIDFFVHAYKGEVRGAFVRGDQMYLLIKDEQKSSEIIAVGEIPERYRGKLPLSVILPSAYYYY